MAMEWTLAAARTTLTTLRAAVPVPHSVVRRVAEVNPDLARHDIADLALAVLFFATVNILLYLFPLRFAATRCVTLAPATHTTNHRNDPEHVPSASKNIASRRSHINAPHDTKLNNHSSSASSPPQTRRRTPHKNNPNASSLNANHTSSYSSSSSSSSTSSSTTTTPTSSAATSSSSQPAISAAVARRLTVLGLPPRIDTQTKFMVASWKAIAYGVSTAIGIYLALSEGWLLDPSLYFANFHQPESTPPMSAVAKLYYKVAFGNYVWAIISIFFEPRQKDFLLMSSHHVVTIILLLLSYIFPFYRSGCAILLLHDINDPIMELAKCFLYMGFHKIADILFFLFAVTFIVNRNYIFPFHIILGVYRYGLDNTISDSSALLVQKLAIAFLCILEAFHIFWASLILRMAKQAIINKGVSDDTRNS